MPDDSLMNRFDRNGLHPVPGARRRARAARVRGAAGGLQGRRAARAGRADGPGLGPRRRAVLRRAGGCDRRRAAVRATRPTTRPRSSHPTRRSTAAAAFENVAAQAGRRAPAGHRGRVRPGDDRRAPRRARSACGRCSSPATRWSSRWTRSSPRRWPDRGVKVVRDVRLGTGISKAFLLDWGELSTAAGAQGEAGRDDRVHRRQRGLPDGGRGRASEVECCAADWAALYANRARRMVDTYRQGGNARVYWITVPTPRGRRTARQDQPRRQRGRARRGAAVGEPGPRDRHGGDVRAPRATRTRSRSTGATASFGPLMGSTSMMRVPGCSRRRFWRDSDRISRTEGPATCLDSPFSSPLCAFLVALPAAAQAATCTPPKYPGSGYFTSLKATKVSCGEASPRSRSPSTSAAPRRRQGPLHVQGPQVLVP